jgi:hypothetical protein
MYYQLWLLVWGRKTLATTTKGKKNDLFIFFNPRKNMSRFHKPGIKERKRTKERQRKDSRKTSQRKK